MADHLIRKPGESTWYVTLIIPADVRPAFGGRTKLTKTTGTSSRPQAMIERLPILAHWKALIAEAREKKKLIAERWRPEIAKQAMQLDKDVDDKLLEALKSKSSGSGRNILEIVKSPALQEVVYKLMHIAIDLERAGVAGAVDQMQTYIMDRIKQFDSTTAVDGMQRAAEFSRNIMAQTAGVVYKLSNAETDEAYDILHNPSSYTPVSPITPARLERFREHRLESVEHRTVNMQESKLKQLSSYLAQGNVLNHETVAEWLESQKYSSRTKVQYLSAFTTFWNWAVKNDSYWKTTYKDSSNPFKDHALPRQSGKERKKTERKDFTPEQLVHLHSVAKSQGQDTLSDVIMLAAYTGCRIEEIGQLRTENILKVEGVLSFDIEDSKTKAGIRQIPVHPAIQTTVQRLIAESEDGFLLPSVNKKNLYGRRSDAWSKSFGKLKMSEGFSSQHVFHSIRATTITQLLRADVQGHIVASIVGHGTDVLTYDVYHKGASPKQKLEALSRLMFNFTQ
ncbi:tyrosine-type recombinase/integrase [Pseudomonas putida]|uniref:tyrosine-type recombinase/integrase n=1 Tax=Pseudomonas putida TaxID=303 RepID=UPI0018D69928|nr:tyrosine-type recombinase/integrase [Pseudomonas putida]MBH3346983.1 tyrosine-type recombinase/integrase [Pseudomonas putida]